MKIIIITDKRMDSINKKMKKIIRENRGKFTENIEILLECSDGVKKFTVRSDTEQ